MSVLCATALAGVLAGCRAQPDASQPAGAATTSVGTGAAVAGDATGTDSGAGAGMDSDLNAVDGQLSGLDSALAQATESPSDGG
jgi:hypothetical protein